MVGQIQKGFSTQKILLKNFPNVGFYSNLTPNIRNNCSIMIKDPGFGGIKTTFCLGSV